MKKFLTILTSILMLVALGGCHKHAYSTEWSSDADNHWHEMTCHDEQPADVAPHTWAASGETDANGDVVYKCSVCGYAHQHVYDAQSWETSAREHWHPVSCEHTDATVFPEEHDFDADTGVCSGCGVAEETIEGYEVAFSYYKVDSNGNPVTDESGYYVQVGVTYTSVDVDGSLPIDTVNGGTLYEGDKISFTVTKSSFCYYTDAADSPLVEIISGTGDGNNTVETIYPDENGVYTVTIQGDTIVSVANVATNPRTITGKGTQEEPFTINSEVDWLYFAMYVNDKSYYSLEYNIGYWKLNEDLDFEGETIYVVGDGYSSVNSVFCGNFDGDGHTISNFVLENSVSASVGTGYSNYLGLFGVVTGYVGIDSVIANLTVENVTVNATAGNDDIVTAGAILGYGVGANVRNCTVRNCTINVIADDTYMSFAGGLVGYLQSGMTDDGMLFYSSVGYSVADNVTIKGSGMLYAAGGIVGRVNSYNDQVTSFIVNCHSSGSISDAFRAGGIVGDLQRYSALQNSYSTANVSAYSTYKSAVESKFDGTAYDDRYSYAGGIVAYAENDTVVEGCFFDGSTYATALAGKSFAKQGKIAAGTSAANFADHYAKAPVLTEQADGVTIDNDYIQNELKWSEADWVFGEGYPTINTEEESSVFTVTIAAGDDEIHSCIIDSQYLPMSYWYILDGNPSITIDTIARYYADGTLRTYGYFFDSALTKPVPAGYVPMRDVTLYAEFADTAAVAGEYYVSNGGVSAVIELATDGTYTYEEGVIILSGEYKFDGEIVTFENSVFSRLASTATALQKANYYTFWAELQQNGDLHLYDCAEIYVVAAEDEEQNSTFTAMARFFAESNPLVIVSAANLSFTGGYYYVDGNVKHVFEFNNDFTGVYKKYTGESVVADTFAFAVNDTEITISLSANGTQFVAAMENGLPVTVEDNRGSEFAFAQIDAFAGVWEKEATTHKIYTFDGMGNWTYEHYVYLVDENLVNATKRVVSRDSGTYTVTDGELSLTRNENGTTVDVLAYVNGGVVTVTENGLPVAVEFTAQNGFKGVWYTASNKIIRYTLTLDGLNADGVGTATLDGFGTVPLDLRYTAVSDNTLYLYVENIVYAVLNYSSKTGLFEGMFYSSATGTTSTPQTLYLYDDFTGTWVSDIEGINSIKFNGFGAYDTVDSTGNNLAVKGIATIGTTSVKYTIDRSTDTASFTYGNVEYVLSYNEYADVISVSYGDAQGTIAKADRYAGVTLLNGDTAYTFDGRGNFAGGGTVTAGDAVGTYNILANGDILMQFDGQADATIVVERTDGVVTGYSLNDTALYIDNVFSGVWAVSGQNVTVTIGEIACVPELGQSLEIAGKYNNADVTMYYNGVDTVTFEYGGKKYSLKSTLGGNIPALIFSETVTVTTEVTTEYVAVPVDEYFGQWRRVTNGNRYALTFDGCGASDYVTAGNVAVKNSNATYRCTYRIVNGVVTIYDNGEVYATFVECEKVNGEYVDTARAYTNGEKYYQLILA